MNFGQALQAMKEGDSVTRSGWNGKDMWIALRTPEYSRVWLNLPYIFMKTADDKLVPWVASNTDLLADDWETVPE